MRRPHQRFDSMEWSQMYLGHCLRPPIKSPCLLAGLLPGLQVTVNMIPNRSRLSDMIDRDKNKPEHSRVLPQVMDLVQPPHLREPGPNRFNKLAARFDPPAPVMSQNVSHVYAGEPSTITYHAFSHCSNVPGCSWYVRSSKTPPSVRGGVVGKNANSWQSCWLRDVR